MADKPILECYFRVEFSPPDLADWTPIDRKEYQLLFRVCPEINFPHHTETVIYSVNVLLPQYPVDHIGMFEMIILGPLIPKVIEIYKDNFEPIADWRSN